MAEKRRGQNFTESEVHILLRLCNHYKKVLECKKTDTVTNREKEVAWNKVSKEFNAACMNSSRTVKQLQEKYKALKKKIKSDYTKSLRYIKGTGGGPYVTPPSPKTEEEKELLETVKLSVEGLTNQFDSDGISGTHGMSPKEIVSESNSVSNYNISVDADWTSASALLWQTPKHPSLQTKNINSLEENENEGGTLFAPYLLDIENENTTNESETINEKVIQPETRGKENEETNAGNGNKKEVISEYSNKKWQCRRRPVLSKRKTASSAGAQFALAAEKKIELIEYQKMVAETELQQSREEHKLRMEILLLKKEKESLLYKMLQQGNLVLEL